MNQMETQQSNRQYCTSWYPPFAKKGGVKANAFRWDKCPLSIIQEVIHIQLSSFSSLALSYTTARWNGFEYKVVTQAKDHQILNIQDSRVPNHHKWKSPQTGNFFQQILVVPSRDWTVDLWIRSLTLYQLLYWAERFPRQKIRYMNL